MSKMLLAQICNPATGEKLPFSSADIYDITRKKSLDQVVDDVLAKLEGLSGAEIKQLKTDLAALKTTFNAFMSGEDDDNGALDRLKELVAAIQANKGSIDALVADKATKTELEALITRVASLEGKNWAVLDGISKSETSGNLVFNGKELTGETGIAICASADAEAVYNGRLKIVLQEIEVAEGA